MNIFKQIWNFFNGVGLEETEERSLCCNDSVRVVGDVTKNYQCDNCGKACDLRSKKTFKELNK